MSRDERDLAGGTATTLVLDALGRPKTRTTGASVDTLSYAGGGNQVARIANSGGSGATTDSIVDPGGLRLGTKTSSTVAWLVPDLHGSMAAALSQAADTVTDALRYDGMGQTVATWPGGGSAASKHWKYQGRLDVSVAGPALYDFEAREMSPGLGTFTSLDTLAGDAGSLHLLNRYVYAVSNPTTLIDPDGHSAQSDAEALCWDQPWSAGCYGGAPAVEVSCADDPSQLKCMGSRSDDDASHATAGGGGSGSATKTPTTVKPTIKVVAACTLATLNCGPEHFNAMTVQQRIDWTQGLMDKYGNSGNFSGWFNNVIGILKFAMEAGLMESGTWESWVNSSILEAITDGLALHRNFAIEGGSINGAALQWKGFFDYRADNRAKADDAHSMHLWGLAEHSATYLGIDLAAKQRTVADRKVYKTLITFGDAYRAALVSPELKRRLGDEIGGLVGSRLGALSPLTGAAVGGAVGSAWGILGAHEMIDPRRKDPVSGNPWSYWMTTWLWHWDP